MLDRPEAGPGRDQDGPQDGTQDVAPQPVETRAEPEEGDVTRTANTVSDPQDVGAAAAATQQPDPEREPEPGPAAPEVAGGEDDPAEKAAEEDQPGADSEPEVNDPEPARKDDVQDRLF